MIDIVYDRPCGFCIPRIYAWVARRRRNFGGTAGACEVPGSSRVPGG